MTELWDDNTILFNTVPSDVNASAPGRRIYTGDNTITISSTHPLGWGKMDFTTSAISADMLGVDNDAVRDNVVNYVRGVGRTTKLGDIFHSKPVVVGPPSRFYFDTGYSTPAGGGFVDEQVHPQPGSLRRDERRVASRVPDREVC